MNCESSSVGDYNLVHHILAAIAIMLLGGIGALIPVLSARFPWITPHENIATFGSFFGTGVVIAAAFIHMVPPAVRHLSNPCLMNNYGPIASLFVMVTVLSMHLVEFIMALKIGSLPEPSNDSIQKPATAQTSRPPLDHTVQSLGGFSKEDSLRNLEANVVPTNNFESNRTDLESACPPTSVFYLFEMGVAVHNLVMGFSLGIVVETVFVMLFMALAFHQFFEGFALGTAVVSMETPPKKTAKILFAYSAAAPVGILIGICARQFFDNSIKNTLYLLGTIEALAAGTLIYTGLIELLTYGLTLNPNFSSKTASKSGTICAFMGLYLGCATMSLYGTWD